MTAIGLDLVFLAPGATGGMETYARALVPALAEARSGVRWVAFCGHELASELRATPWVDGLEVIELPVSSDTRVRREVAAQLLLPVLVRRARVDLVHGLGGTAALAPGGPPLVLTVHDLIWVRYPETHARLLARGLSVLVPRAVRRAKRLIVPSETTARDLRDLLGLDRAVVDVVPEGPGLPAVAEPTPEGEIRARLGLGDRPLVLCPSAQRPHKNVRRLVEAMAGLEATLVVPGYASLREPGLVEAEARASVVAPGWLPAADLEGLYAAATAVVLPSLAEGFGLPAVEAMARGLPVACSRATALEEVAGDAALSFDATDVASIRAAVARLLDDDALRTELAARGRRRVGRFTWDAAAAGTWRTYDAVLGGSREP